MTSNCLNNTLVAKTINTLLGGDEHLLQFLIHHKKNNLRLPRAQLLLEAAKELSSSDFTLICIAVDLFTGLGLFSKSIKALDDKVFLHFLTALAVRKEHQECSEALECLS